MGSRSLKQGQSQLALWAGAWVRAGELVARWGLGLVFSRGFSAFLGSEALWWWQRVGRGWAGEAAAAGCLQGGCWALAGQTRLWGCGGKLAGQV